MSSQTVMMRLSSSSVSSMHETRATRGTSLVLRLSSTRPSPLPTPTVQPEERIESTLFQKSHGESQIANALEALFHAPFPFVRFHWDGLTRNVLTTLAEAVSFAVIVQVAVIPVVLNMLSAVSEGFATSAIVSSPQCSRNNGMAIPSSGLLCALQTLLIAIAAASSLFVAAKVALPLTKVEFSEITFAMVLVVSTTSVCNAPFLNSNDCHC